MTLSRVSEIFYSQQGEDTMTGLPVTFVRFAFRPSADHGRAIRVLCAARRRCAQLGLPIHHAGVHWRNGQRHVNRDVPSGQAADASDVAHEIRDRYPRHQQERAL